MIYTYIPFFGHVYIPCNIPLWPSTIWYIPIFGHVYILRLNFPLFIFVYVSNVHVMYTWPLNQRRGDPTTPWPVKTEPDSMPLIESKWPNPLEWKKNSEGRSLEAPRDGIHFPFRERRSRRLRVSERRPLFPLRGSRNGTSCLHFNWLPRPVRFHKW